MTSGVRVDIIDNVLASAGMCSCQRGSVGKCSRASDKKLIWQRPHVRQSQGTGEADDTPRLEAHQSWVLELGESEVIREFFCSALNFQFGVSSSSITEKKRKQLQVRISADALIV